MPMFGMSPITFPHRHRSFSMTSRVMKREESVRRLPHHRSTTRERTQHHGSSAYDRATPDSKDFGVNLVAWTSRVKVGSLTVLEEEQLRPTSPL